ncbi:MAG: GlsB/YeaQ/YmgE family stress response membrane protein [Pseudobdellovibrio sp.]
MQLDSILSHPLIQQTLLWLGLGLGVGVAAKIIIPGNEHMGWIRTIAVGLLGTFLGNYVAPKMLDWPSFTPFSLQGVGIGIAGAVVFVVINRIVTSS